MTKPRSVCLIILALVLSLPGCALGNARYSLRQVNGPVHPIVVDGSPDADLLIVNMQPSSDSPYHVTYTAMEGDRRRVRWDAPLDGLTSGRTSRAQTLLDESQFYIAIEDTLHAYSLSDGSHAWAASLSDVMPVAGQNALVRAGDRIIALTEDRVLHGLDRKTGLMAWQQRLNSGRTHPQLMTLYPAGDWVAVFDEVSDDTADGVALYVFAVQSGSLAHRIQPVCQGADLRWGSTLRLGDNVLFDETGRQSYFFMDKTSDQSCVQGWDIAADKLLFQYDLSGDAFDLDHTHSVLRADLEPIYVSPHAIYATISDSTLRRLDLRSGEVQLLLDQEDYVCLSLWEQDSVLAVLCQRTRGSDRTELWGIETPSGERLWRFQLQVQEFRHPRTDRGVGMEATALLTRHGLSILQMVEDATGSDDAVIVDLLDVETGEVRAHTETQIGESFWTGIAWTDDAAYLTIRNVQSVRLESGLLAWEWPLWRNLR